MRIERCENEPIQLLKDRRRLGGLTQQQITEAIIEYQSCEDIHRKRDLEELVVSTHLPGALRIAKPYHQMSHEELLSLVYFAIKKAMTRFDPKKKTTFLTYLRFWLRNELQRNRADEQFSLCRHPFERDALYRACKSIELKLTQEQGTIPELSVIHREGVRRKNPLFVTKHGTITLDEFTNIVGTIETPIVSLQTDRYNEFEYASDQKPLSPSAITLIHELHGHVKGLFEDYLLFIVSQLGFMEADLCLEYLLLGKSLNDAGALHQLSRERARTIITKRLPECLQERGLYSPKILTELATITLLTYEFCDHALSPVLEKLSYLNHELTDISLSIFADGSDYLSVFQSLRETMSEHAHSEPIIFKRSKSAPYRSAKERWEKGRHSRRLPAKLKTTQDLLQALRVTMFKDEPVDQRLFPFGRETLYLLYSETHHPVFIDDLLSEASTCGDIILYRNAVQGEAIKFWPSPDITPLAKEKLLSANEASLHVPAILPPPSRVFHLHQRQQRLTA
ncbi:MAG: hypothetical protein KC582_00295 [Candidatus Magasanikbacteria bacterium]|nr:hypothetical protein [Candidatus Magasanikbacteria bacterium]MCA9390686.1 hypothetical protein [Candidatus Magasanikbacteria bacterium]HPF95254.1 sigma factor [bacterium]